MQNIRFQTIYPETIIKIKKGEKSGCLQNFTKEKISEQFNYLKQYIDDDPAHEERLIPNNDLNRYSNIRPYKDNVVQINSNNKYINASWVHLPTNKSFIATQGPLDTTIDDFWQMVDQYNINLIIMLCKLEENNKVKCSKYWDNTNIHNFTLEKCENEFEYKEGLTLRNYFLKKSINQLLPPTIIQLQDTCWEDHSAPDRNSYNKIIDLIEFIDIYKNNQPVIVHCSAGVGRSGTFISLYNLYNIIMKQIKDINTNEIKFSIMNIVRQIKEMRIHSVQNEKQYLYLYEFVKLLLDEKN